MSTRKIRTAGFTLLLTIILVPLLAGCNPKPEPVQKEDPLDQPSVMIPTPEKLADVGPKLTESILLMQGLEQVGAYWDAVLSDADYAQIYTNPAFNYDSIIDLIQQLTEKGIAIIPQYGESDAIFQALDQGHPVLAQFPSSGIEITAIFYGYNEEFAFYYNVSGMKERKIKVESLKTLNEKELKLFLYQPDSNVMDSEYYFLLYTRDIFMKNDLELYAQAVERMEREPEWFEKDNTFLRFYAYYYTFNDPQPDKVEPLLAEIRSPIPALEINFMHHLNRGDREKAIESMSRMNLGLQQVATYRDQTIYHLGVVAMEEGLTDAALHALQILHERNPDYPGLKEALEKLK